MILNGYSDQFRSVVPCGMDYRTMCHWHLSLQPKPLRPGNIPRSLQHSLPFSILAFTPFLAIISFTRTHPSFDRMILLRIHDAVIDPRCRRHISFSPPLRRYNRIEPPRQDIRQPHHNQSSVRDGKTKNVQGIHT
jgi:hypothetical protein